MSGSMDDAWLPVDSAGACRCLEDVPDVHVWRYFQDELCDDWTYGSKGDTFVFEELSANAMAASGRLCAALVRHRQYEFEHEEGPLMSFNIIIMFHAESDQDVHFEPPGGYTRVLYRDAATLHAIVLLYMERGPVMEDPHLVLDFGTNHQFVQRTRIKWKQTTLDRPMFRGDPSEGAAGFVVQFDPPLLVIDGPELTLTAGSQGVPWGLYAGVLGGKIIAFRCLDGEKSCIQHAMFDRWPPWHTWRANNPAWSYDAYVVKSVFVPLRPLRSPFQRDGNSKLFLYWMQTVAYVAASRIQRAYRRRLARKAWAIAILRPAIMHWAARPYGPLYRAACMSFARNL